MSTKKIKANLKISRLEAAKLLSVSVRTVDRYIRAKKLSISKVDKAIWLSKSEVVALVRPPLVDMSSPSVSTDVHVDNGRQKSVNASELVDNLSTPSNKIFENLYYKLKEEVKENQQRLEMANYRVGHLESQIQATIPLIEHQNLSEKFSAIQKDLLRQSIIKWALILSLLTLLALQPLWFYFLV